MKQLLIVSLLLFLISSVALGLALSRGVRSKQWSPVAGVIGGSSFGMGGGGGGNKFGWRTVKDDYESEANESLL